AKRPAQAQSSTEEALRLYREVKDDRGAAQAELQLGACHEQSGKVPQAQEHYDQALRDFHAIGSVEGEARSAASLGALEEKQNHFASAEQHYLQALNLLENVRDSLAGLTEIKVGYLETQIPVYQRYIHFLLQAQQNAKAFEWTQKAKARALLDL